MSTSVSGRGTTLNFGKKGARATVGIPGSGLSWSQSLFGRRGSGGSASSGQASSGSSALGCLGLFFLLAMIAMCGRQPSSSGAGFSQNNQQERAAGAEAARTAYVVPKEANCRSAAQAASAILEKLPRGSAVQVTQASGGWSRIDRAGASCWVLDRLLAGAPPVMGPPAGSQSFTRQPLMDAGRSVDALDYPEAPAPQRAFRSRRYAPRRQSSPSAGSCPCSSGNVCIGPRGGRYCITSGGNKRYGV